MMGAEKCIVTNYKNKFNCIMAKTTLIKEIHWIQKEAGRFYVHLNVIVYSG